VDPGPRPEWRRDRLVVAPREPLVGSAAARLERHIQDVFRAGRRQLIVDLSGVSEIDGAGIQALARGVACARRLGGDLLLSSPRPSVARALSMSNPTSLFDVYSSVDAARLAAWPWRAIRLAAGGSALCGALVWAGLHWPAPLAGFQDEAAMALAGKSARAAAAIHQFQPFLELLKLVAAALVGVLVTAVHRPVARDRRSSMRQAQTLLCVSGAVMMIIIGNSLARAFGIAGAASIIRFRTPVDDPKDVTVLFLLMGLGMSLGLGAFAVAGLGAAFLCVALIALDRMSEDSPRVLSVAIVASDRLFPTAHVEAVFMRHRVVFEPREMSTADCVTVRYQAWLDSRTSLEDLSAELMREGAGLKSVTWEPAKRERV
jgi:anti-anti-sigma factor